MSIALSAAIAWAGTILCGGIMFLIGYQSGRLSERLSQEQTDENLRSTITDIAKQMSEACEAK